MADTALTGGVTGVTGAQPVRAAGATTRPPAPAGRPRRRAFPIVLRVVVVLWVAVLVLLPVATLCYRAFDSGATAFFDTLRDPDTVHAFLLTAIVAGISVLIDMVFGIAVAILLVRYRFPGRGLLSAFVDLPIAVSPIVAGLALLLVFGPDGWFGSFLADSVVGSTPGLVLATVFVSLPIVARAIVPVLEQAGLDQEQAAASLGANAAQRFWRITLPTIRVALAYGVVLAVARCIGEYGAVLVVSGNFEGESETAALRVGNILDNSLGSDVQAYSIAFTLMVIAVVAILVGALICRNAGGRIGRPARAGRTRQRDGETV